MICGDEEEHAVLLACYMLHLEQLRQTSEADEQTAVSLRVYLCVGEAVPEGELQELDWDSSMRRHLENTKQDIARVFS